MYVLGVDIGTTNWKIIAYDEQGADVARYTCPTKTHHLGNGWAIYDPEEIWEAVCTGIREVIGQIGSADGIKAVAATSVGEAGVLIDRDGRPLYPAIAWFDPRTEEQLIWWEENYDRRKVYEITGFPPQYIPSINKIMWLKKHEPEAYAKAWKWLCIADYVAFRLSGQAVMDYSLASRTMMFDIRKRSWSMELLEAAGIDPALMPELAHSGTAIGKLTESAARETGLSPSTVVCTGGHDHICGALAVNVINQGGVLDSLGTAEAILMVMDEPKFSQDLMDSGFALGCHTARDKYYLIGALQTGGATVEWLKNELAYEERQAELSGKGNVYALMMEKAAQAPVGSEGLFLLPHLRGSVCPVNEKSRAAFVGLQAHHTKAYMFRAAIESLAHEFRKIIDDMASLSGVPARKIVVIGGGTRNDFWLQTKADVTGKQLEVPDLEEATTLGAGILAGLGAGVFKDEAEVAGRIYRVKKSVPPDLERYRSYDQYHPIYRKIYGVLKDLNDEISTVFGS